MEPKHMSLIPYWETCQELKVITEDQAEKSRQLKMTMMKKWYKSGMLQK